MEERIAAQLQEADVPFDYESTKLKYTVPARHATYTPDFDLDGFKIEAKGYFRSAAERQKLILVKQANPDEDIRLLFQRADKPIYKGSKTTYADWATTHGFKWADGGKVPAKWIEECRKTKN